VTENSSSFYLLDINTNVLEAIESIKFRIIFVFGVINLRVYPRSFVGRVFNFFRTPRTFVFRIRNLRGFPFTI